jgi:hypothetical protein
VRKSTIAILAWVVAVLAGGPARAGAVDRAARAVAGRLARSTSGEGTEALARRLAARQGAEVIEAARRVGPGAIHVVEHAGAQANVAARLLARHGPAAARVVSRPRALALVARHGDDAARALVRHGRLAEPAIEELGRPAARALAVLSPRQARRLVEMAGSGDLARIGRTGELLRIVEEFGDRAMGFVWRHKGALAVGTVLAAFLADPGPFLGGAKGLAGAASGTVAGLSGQVAAESASGIAWTIVGLAALVSIGPIRWRLKPSHPHTRDGRAM